MLGAAAVDGNDEASSSLLVAALAGALVIDRCPAGEAGLTLAVRLADSGRLE